nr:NAD-dependent epimerase/dehydratase family protein [Nitrospinaceae bacterium]NIR56195.1 NAD-dependent epimerase/dehydratase family protein [Nitrospinaceae bacterium]NIS86651.1 NAD-dependent epimerase/dehydratase family protein [Nitrospinaceae bacterium]NIT83484.1 NAD-dependent epimerase/dehydratase family protein [Nitrospinaceae bacterium]NIU45689.1 NAD-dependent epimerase/dehydratase family protein [Nitrospinaceae bacterium]
NLSHIRSDRFQWIRQDVSDPFSVDGDLDYVLNLASPASPLDYYQYPLETMKVGAFGTHYLLELAKSKNAVFFQASTSEVYGDPLQHPQKESYWGNVNPIGRRSVYDEAKRFGEAMVTSYQREFGMATRIVRIFNTYGPRMALNDGRAIPNFMYQALQGRDLTVYGDGSQTRSFCYVSDLIEGMYRLLTSSVTVPVNIGNPVELTLLEMAEKILQVSGSKSKIVHKPLPEDDPKVRRPDIGQARKLLNWEPRVDLEEGLRATLEYFKQRIEAQSAEP